MAIPRARVLVVLFSGLLSGCASAPRTVAPPPPPVAPPPPPPIIAQAQAWALPPAAAESPLDATALVIARAEAEFDLGRAEFDRARLVSAREHFDRAVDWLIKQQGGARTDARLQAAFERLVDRITALEVQALRDADGITEAKSEPAAIDTLVTRPTLRASSTGLMP